MKAIVILFVLLCFGCKTPEAKAPASLVNEPYSQDIYHSKPITPGEEVCDTSFAVFIKKFENDTVFQLRHTEFPLFYRYSDEDFPLDILESYVDRNDFEYVQFSKDSIAYRGKKHPAKLFVKRAKDSVHYYLSGKNSYVDLRYHFAFKDGCWYLVQFDDMTD